jgi:hypothetical protein
MDRPLQFPGFVKSRELLILILLVGGCRFEEDGLDWAVDAGESPDDPDDPDAADDPPTPDSPDAAVTPPTPDSPDAAPACEEPFDTCDGECVDLDTDRDHCGECGHDCDSDEICKDGECRKDNSGPG